MEPRNTLRGGSNVWSHTISRISAYVGDGGLVCPLIPHRTDAPDVSSDIKVVANPSSITETADLFTSVFVTPVAKYNLAPTTGFVWWFHQHTKVGRTALGDLFHSCSKGQAVTIAAGEGIAFRQPATNLVAFYRRAVHVVVEVGGYAYSVVVPLGSQYLSLVPLVIFNTAGSGLSCKVLSVSEIQDAEGSERTLPSGAVYGTPNVPQLVISVLSEETRYNTDYLLSTPVVGMQSGGAGETELSCYVGSRTPDIEVFDTKLLAMATAGNFPPNTSMSSLKAACEAGAFRAIPMKDQYRRGDTVSSSITLSLMQRGVLWKSRGGVGLCVRPGQSLVVRSMGSEYCDVVVSGTVSVIPSGSYPGVGDVDFGVEYGPNAEYTGTLVQPAESDVESGVQYGAGGTEFTGTATGGGGGNTYSRGRITNA